MSKDSRTGAPEGASRSGPKTALELAMERLSKKDADEGIVQQVLTDEQKAAIAEVRSVCQAKLAHAEVMRAAALASGLDATPGEVIEEQYQRDRERFVSERDAKITRIRGGGREK